MQEGMEEIASLGHPQAGPLLSEPWGCEQAPHCLKEGEPAWPPEAYAQRVFGYLWAGVEDTCSLATTLSVGLLGRECL